MNLCEVFFMEWLNYQHLQYLLGESAVALFAAPALAKIYRKRFPDCLTDAPLLMPMENTVLRRSVDQWQYGCGMIGQLDGVVERFYASSIERRIKHPALSAICQSARERLLVHGP